MDYQTAFDLLRSDIEATIDVKAHAEVWASLAMQLEGIVGIAGLPTDEWLVETVQQMIHDCHIDTVWPRCPTDARHPLWFSEGHWRCDKDNVVIPLGGLHSPDSR